MTRAGVLAKLKELSPKLKEEGFEIIGLFGSCAREQQTETSDIDILYTISDIDAYLKKYRGWESVNHIVETKEYLKKELGNEVDFVDQSSLNEVGQKYILKDLIRV